MAYPTDVTEPRFGADAFADNDPASQLAQAAFVLLLGQELRASRGRRMTPRMPEEPRSEDAARFDIPRIDFTGRRYRAREALESAVRRPKRPPRDADALYALSRDLAYRLQETADEATAAALLQVCVARPDVIVRVAAAAAS